MMRRYLAANRNRQSFFRGGLQINEAGKCSYLEANLLYAVALARFRAGDHLGLFNHPFAVLHPDALLGTFGFVKGVTHAETAPAAGRAFGHWRGALKRKCCQKNDSEKRSHAGLATASESYVSPGRTSNVGNEVRSVDEVKRF